MIDEMEAATTPLETVQGGHIEANCLLASAAQLFHRRNSPSPAAAAAAGSFAAVCHGGHLKLYQAASSSRPPTRAHHAPLYAAACG
jgi:hypothetical protein